MQLREAKQILRAALETASDEKLAEMLAWAQDGMMRFEDPCACFVGSLGAEMVHDDAPLCGQGHYSRVRNQFPMAEHAYCHLGFVPNNPDIRPSIRQRRIIPIIKAQMRIRELHRKDAREFVSNEVYA